MIPGPAPGPAKDRRITVYDDLEALSDAAARELVNAAQEGVALNHRFAVALAGGATPIRTYQLLADRYAADVPWDRTDVFFSDERCVPPDDVDSNYGTARGALLSRVPLDPGRVHPIPAFGVAPAAGAERYEAELRRYFRAAGETSPVATFDLALLGIGADGHTASLFPGHPAVVEQHSWVVAVRAPGSVVPSARITLTPAVLNRSRHVLILAAGEGKRRAVADALSVTATEAGRSFPAALVSGTESTRWLLDAGAAPSPSGS